MKNLKLILATFTLLSLPFSAMADSLTNDMNSLGGNEKLIERAKAFDPDNKVRIVQNRLVDRHWRLELGVNYGANSGGDPYVNTDNLGASVDLHITPMFSVGARYYNHSNTLSDEGERRVQAVQSARLAGVDPGRPAIDAPVETYMGVINFYPTYGKLNLFDQGVAQFDIYLLGGYGQIQLQNTSSDTYTAGAGLGLWISQHVSTRFEARYQTYKDKATGEERDLDLTVFSASLGLLL